MRRVRRCDSRCHNAKGSRCACWCQSAFHGAAGASNRSALQNAEMNFLEAHGFKKGETVYIEQEKLPLKDGDADHV